MLDLRRNLEAKSTCRSEYDTTINKNFDKEADKNEQRVRVRDVKVPTAVAK